MKLDIRALVSKVEFLGLDTQPLRDFYTLLNDSDFNLDPYVHTITTLKNQVSKPYSPNSQPTAIALILRELDKKIKDKVHLNADSLKADSTGGVNLNADDIRNLIEDTMRNMSGQTNNINQELLKVVDSLNTSVQGLKRSDSYREKNESNEKQIEEVFVNPIDEKKVENIKGNITIDSKKGNNIKNKLNKLKSLSKNKL